MCFALRIFMVRLVENILFFISGMCSIRLLQSCPAGGCDKYWSKAEIATALLPFEQIFQFAVSAQYSHDNHHRWFPHIDHCPHTCCNVNEDRS